MKLFIINGYAGSGKDEFVNYVREITSNEGLQVANIHSSDRAKEALKLLNWSGAKSKEIRRLLAELCDFGQSRGVSIELISAQQLYNDVVFFHERNPEQIREMLRLYPNATTIWLSRPNIDTKVEDDRWDMARFPYDLVVYNNGTLEELREAAKEFVETYTERRNENES